MAKLPAKLLLIAMASFGSSAFACHPAQPVPGDTGKFDAIFVGEVTGIRLTGYENVELGKHDACDIAEDGEEPMCFNITSDPAVSIFALPRVVIRGDIKDVQELNEAGCNKESISLGDRGIFFVNQGGHSAAVVWEGQPEFDGWLERLGASFDER